MADIVVTAAQVAVVYPHNAEIYDFIANEAINAGQAVYLLTTGKVGLADANAAGQPQQFRGIALKTVGAGQAVSVLKKGWVAGFAVSALNRDAVLYLSDNAGALADTASVTKTVNCGRVMSIPDSALTKAVYIEADWLRAW